MIIFVAVILLLSHNRVSVTAYIHDNPEVTIEQGQLRGEFWNTRQGRSFSAFLGIPYAEPPIGERRFQPPVPAKPWNGIRDATKAHVMCPQRNIYVRSELIEGDEDCLYLNVYTPKVPQNRDTLYPVLVFLHGGGWLCGTGNSNIYSPKILMDKDVVLVVPNYRLAALGFLSTADEVAPGNNALKDQNLVLKWIHRNIGTFGGDSSRVMLFGESAGAVSTHLHMLSPMSQGLFHAAISQSGTALAPWGFASAEEGAKQSKRLAKALKCPTLSSKRMVECLRKISAYEIIGKDKIFMEWDTDPMIPFKPVIEPNIAGAFLTEHPIQIIKSGKSGNIPWITGINTEDGALRAATIFGNTSLSSELDREFNHIAPISLFYNREGIDKEFITKQIREFYFDKASIDDSTRFNAVDMYTDAWFLANADQSVELHKKYSKNPIYYYLFGHRGVGSMSVLFGDPTQRYGVCHADELLYLFPIDTEKVPFDKADAFDNRMADLLSTLWTNFASFGNPTPKLNSLIHTQWQPVEDLDDFEYYIIGGGVHRAKGLLEERAKFWRALPTHINSMYKDEL